MILKRFLLAGGLCLALALPCSAAWQIGLQDGCVALMQNGTVVEQSAVPATLLPARDRALLGCTVHFASRAGACRLMEDLTG